MQTFLPYYDFKFSAQCLDNKRLGKQRVEAWQILQALRGLTKGWVNHPATVMWRGHEQALIHYGMVISAEWEERGFEDNMFARFQAEFDGEFDYAEPWWLGLEEFHISHQSNLLRKDPIHYKQFNVPNDLPYLWGKPDGTFVSGAKQKVLV
jgi:hypothetical protein